MVVKSMRWELDERCHFIPEETLMTTAELAKAFTDLLSQGDHEGAAKKYNSDNIVSYEAMDGPMAVCKGKEAVKQKGDWWNENHELHGGSVEGPFVNGDQFAVRFKLDVTPKETGERVVMDEVGIYTVKDGKIVEERFFY
ncbi:Ketosteroid isomerase-related protein [Mesorhizobium albiziae]|uniref:Ketosteroid isomerase-related protein n=2 Tax=Neomesorhizobium albiziae TaxID=335020 RepID=A0A1I4AEW7_9HYPH|nr:ketosteroid isomerase [Mesorhizobium albiziae]SFK54853.1 Ketosteroid isomerase-related protein [Mesorhizobium albiziae]